MNRDMSAQWDRTAEWLEADGLGGFASGTVVGMRTRRYHALLLAATTPPTGRFVLVNGFDAWVETEGGSYPLTYQHYTPDVYGPDITTRSIERFEADPWPRWTYRLADGTRIVHELFVRHGSSNTVLSWRREGGAGVARLRVRPFLSGRDYHGMHKANDVFRFDAQASGERVLWRPYDGLPGIWCQSNGTYRQEPHWYRNFLYDEEQARGLDCTEDLGSPGLLEFDLSRGEAVMILAADVPGERVINGASAQTAIRQLRDAEQKRRSAFPTRLHRAADAYLARRGEGKTIIAGYPWFTDWGRDTFIAVRGLCIATGRLDDARDILMAWTGEVSEGMLPNRFVDHGESAEYNAVDASLWFVVAAHEWREAMKTAGRRVAKADNDRLDAAILAILEGYSRGTRFGIRMDEDGLIAAGVPGVQLTWMDAKCGDWVVTPRIGKPVEIQALWLNALHIGAQRDANWQRIFVRAYDSFHARFWNDEKGCLYDVIDVDHQPGVVDGAVRPNQVFAVGGLPLMLVDGERAARIVDIVEQKLLTPLGLRTLAPDEPGYTPRYEGGPSQRDGAYHQGTVWPWLMGPFVEAWVRVEGATPAAKREARQRFVEPLLQHVDVAGVGHVSEIADATPPFTPKGCPFQAWSVGELLRIELDVLADRGPVEERQPLPPRRRQPVAAAKQ